MEQLKQKVAREREIRRAFQRYAPPAVVDALFDSGRADPFPGELRIVAALYCGVHGFYDLSARLPAARVVTLLNSCLRVMHNVVVRHHGTVIDNRVAVFGAPVSSLTNAENAVQAALEMLEALKDFNHRQALDLLGEEISIGVAVHLGEAVTGTVSSAEKMEYSVIGEAVDVAARLWKLTSETSDSILITRSVHDETRDLVDVEALGGVVLRGRDEATETYRVRSAKG
jgi:adenylate cyclase